MRKINLWQKTQGNWKKILPVFYLSVLDAPLLAYQTSQYLLFSGGRLQQEDFLIKSFVHLHLGGVPAKVTIIVTTTTTTAPTAAASPASIAATTTATVSKTYL